MVKVTDQSAPDQRDNPNLPLEPITSSSKKTTPLTGMETTRKPKPVPPKVLHTKSLLNTLLYAVNTMPKRQSPTTKPPRLVRLVKPQTASEERAPNTSVKSPDKTSQSHSVVEILLIATVRTTTVKDTVETTNLTALADYF
jgi:hypothetical protein